jgi:hypothetical protein
MTPISPRLLKGGIVQVDAASGRVLRTISLQYNPDTLTRTLQVQAAGAGGGGPADRSLALRLKGAAVETIKLEAEIDATDALADPGSNPDAVSVGIHPQLAVLESLVNPRADALQANDALVSSGALEILPPESPLALFVWSKQRVVPVRITELSVTEEAFDAALNPIRAKVSLGLRVLTVDDVPFQHRAAATFMSYLRTKEGLAGRVRPVSPAQIGFEV